MGRRILVTGGAGFIGSHLCERLLADGHEVRVLDNLCAPVHGLPRAKARRVPALGEDVELIVGDVRDARACARALLGVEAVLHLAARVGVGQSMYEIGEYASVNTSGTATLLETLVKHPVERLVVASSMSVYGEGAYADDTGARRTRVARTAEQLREREWEPRDAGGGPLRPLAASEEQPVSLASVYALSKFDQEQLCLSLGRTYGIDTVALRLFNVYGPRQATPNPSTGVVTIFSRRLQQESAPLINEDGLQRRDFVHVRDVVEAFVLALERPGVGGQVFNVGSGTSVTIREVAKLVAGALGRAHVAPSITGQHRPGDVRHCFADLGRARAVLGFAPRVPLAAGLAELAGWMSAQGRKVDGERPRRARRARPAAADLRQGA